MVSASSRFDASNACSSASNALSSSAVTATAPAIPARGFFPVRGQITVHNWRCAVDPPRVKLLGVWRNVVLLGESSPQRTSNSLVHRTYTDLTGRARSLRHARYASLRYATLRFASLRFASLARSLASSLPLALALFLALSLSPLLLARSLASSLVRSLASWLVPIANAHQAAIPARRPTEAHTREEGRTSRMTKISGLGCVCVCVDIITTGVH